MSAKLVKDFLALHRVAVLCTHSKTQPGYPFGSIVPYDIDTQGRISIFISTISEHYRNVLENPRACIFVAEQSDVHDPQPNARASVLGIFGQVPESEVTGLAESYNRRFPKSPSRSISHDFRFFRMEVEKIRWIGGFGEIHWVSGESYSAALFDPISYIGSDIISHMNQDHADALCEFARYYGGIDSTGKQAMLVNVTREQFMLCLTSAASQDSEQRVSIAFPKPVSTAKEVRETMIEMLRACRK